MKETLESLKAAAAALNAEKQARATAGTPNQRVIIALNLVLEAVSQLNYDATAEAARLAAEKTALSRDAATGGAVETPAK